MIKIHLNLKKNWFDMHLDVKDEEYREIKPYFINKFCRLNGKKLNKEMIQRLLSTGEKDYERIQYLLIKKTLTFVCDEEETETIFSNGMKPLAVLPRFTKKVIDITIGIGKKEWGAPDYPVFIIKCSDVLTKNNC